MYVVFITQRDGYYQIYRGKDSVYTLNQKPHQKCLRGMEVQLVVLLKHRDGAEWSIGLMPELEIPRYSLQRRPVELPLPENETRLSSP
jgi:hypothetical protein